MQEATAEGPTSGDGRSSVPTDAAAPRADLPERELRGPLSPAELAEAAVLGNLSLVLVILGWFLPLGQVLFGVAIVPFAALAARHRARATVMATLAASLVALLVGGIGIVLEMALVGSLGLAIGMTYRRRWPRPTSVAFAALTTGVPVALGTLALDAISPGLRKLAFAQVELVWRAVAKVLNSLGLDKMAERGTQILAWCIHYWWITVPLFEFTLVVLVAIMAAHYLWPLLVRLERDSPAPVEPTRRLVDGDGAERFTPAPVPVELERVSYQYPGSFDWAVAEVSLALEPGRLIALVGPNGSGKSTLVRLVSGRLAPTLGSIRRAGSPGLGRPGGTAVVSQRPESQVLGVRAGDDVIWGLPPGRPIDVEAMLGRVGLGGFAERETSSLSGGELQRLAIAAALARTPRLLISDEATAMIDQEGRAEVVELLESLAASGLAVVHVTHREAEAARADDVVLMLGGRRLPSAATDPASPPRTAAPRHAVAPAGQGPGLEPDPPATVLSLRGVGYVYSAGTPWARRALEGIDLDLHRGEGVVVAGANGSGKSTLAWLLAGLSAPTEGTALLDGEPFTAGDAAVGIAFQHARLQLIRATVLADVAYGVDDDRASAALRAVGLDPVTMGRRRVDELSGGEQRRVALAGLLVRDPQVIVLDEPYAGLDDEARRSLAALLSELRTTRGIATVVVSHDLDNAGLLGEQLVRLEAGRIVAREPLGGDR